MTKNLNIERSKILSGVCKKLLRSFLALILIYPAKPMMSKK
ncbi:Uncharacterized protein dnm_093920 [Desulfonema magnum]|uniref:Uncharacterized protein n=1 Tax=Desulfonema magnum TaxID=45655 RepID=A0A975BWZ1_9BACT|nr:Uncharacterized protein dnm_093920 [Desulfonema magnum]